MNLPVVVVVPMTALPFLLSLSIMLILGVFRACAKIIISEYMSYSNDSGKLCFERYTGNECSANNIVQVV